jgi:hypothetical protein
MQGSMVAVVDELDKPSPVLISHNSQAAKPATAAEDAPDGSDSPGLPPAEATSARDAPAANGHAHKDVPLADAAAPDCSANVTLHTSSILNGVLQATESGAKEMFDGRLPEAHMEHGVNLLRMLQCHEQCIL